jgi:EpsG family
MILGDVLALLIGASALMVLGLQMHAQKHVSLLRRPDWISNGLAGALVVTFFVMLAFRNRDFGVDTAAYSEIFKLYCANDPLADFEPSFRYSAAVLNAGMLGRCDVNLLPAIWVLIIVAGLLLMPIPKMRLRFAALLLFSLIGFELTTNALRQGLSVTILLLALSYWGRNRVVALALAATAVTFHSSTALVLVAWILSTMAWRSFLIVFGAAIGGIVFALQTGTIPTFVQPFFYEVQKYLMTEADEIWVRVLAFACVVAALTIPLICNFLATNRREALLNLSYATAVRLSLTCLPALALPYFGYRYVYGIYPLVLYLTFVATSDVSKRRGRHFILLLGFNTAVLLVWSIGSNYMRKVPFFD